MAKASPLRRRRIEDMTIRNLSPATQQSYIHAVARFSLFFRCSPDRLGLEEVRRFQLHLLARGISWSGLNQIVCALRFFYGTTLGRTELPGRIAYAHEPRKLPEVPGTEEVVQFLDAVANPKHRIALITAYDTGLLAAKVVHLKLADIDSSRMT
jgi:integrase/recombinase XerD